MRDRGGAKPDCEHPAFGRAGWPLLEARTGLTFAAFALLVLGFLWQASIHWSSVIDDAFISLRFSDMLTRGHGLRFNVADAPVEGFTNFLWTVILAAPIALGWDAVFWAKLLGLACAVGTMAVACGFARDLRGRRDVFNLMPAVLLATNSSFANWALLGLETQGAVFLILSSYYRFHREMNDPRARLISPWLATLAAMTRIDSLFFLAPLGLYGAGLVASRRSTPQRLLAWAAIAALSFGAYFGWKAWYFEDPLPNTYYAKTRLVRHDQATRVLEQRPAHTRGRAQLTEFYLKRNSEEATPGAPPPDSGALARAVASVDWWLRSGPYAPMWMLWWGASLATLLARPRPRNLVLIVTPLLLCTYYVHRVDGDWMPSFRFFQLALPFLAIAGPVALGLIQDAVAGRWRYAAYLVFGAALVGTSLDQLRVDSSFVWGPGRAVWKIRPPEWYTPASVRSRLRQGFEAPLPVISDWLLMNTPDGATIFTSDFGQPMWFATHLNHLDVDGLTDRHLAHAPSVRGDLPTLEEHYAVIAAQRFPDGVTREEEDRAHAYAEIADFEAHLARNTEYILAERKPDYLIFFIQSGGPEPNENGRVYPEISARIHRDPRRAAEYEVAAVLPKVEGIHNWIYRRRDVAQPHVGDRVKLERLRRTLERNPRFHYLIKLTWDEMRKMTDPEVRAEARELVRDELELIAGNSLLAFHLSLRLADEGGLDVARELVGLALQSAPGDVTLWRRAADMARIDGDADAAVAAFEEALRLTPEHERQFPVMVIRVLHYMGRDDDALRLGRRALERWPDHLPVWRELAGLAERMAARPAASEEMRLRALRSQLEALEGLRRHGPQPASKRLDASIERVMGEIGQVERRQQRAPATP